MALEELHVFVALQCWEFSWGISLPGGGEGDGLQYHIVTPENLSAAVTWWENLRSAISKKIMWGPRKTHSLLSSPCLRAGLERLSPVLDTFWIPGLGWEGKGSPPSWSLFFSATRGVIPGIRTLHWWKWARCKDSPWHWEYSGMCKDTFCPLKVKM